jgi:hypothetical protein
MALTFSKGIAVVAALCLIMLLLCFSCPILGYTYYVWQERYRIDLQVCSAVVPAVHDVEVTWTTDGSHWEVMNWSEYIMRRKLRFSSMTQRYAICYGTRALPQYVGVRFTDEGGKRHEIYARLALPPKFGGTIILVLKRREKEDDYELAMFLDKYNQKELWKLFWDDSPVKRNLQTSKDRSRFNFGFLTDARVPLSVTWFRNNFLQKMDNARTLVEVPIILSRKSVAWTRGDAMMSTPPCLYIIFLVQGEKREYLLDCQLQDDSRPDPLPENFKGDIVALVHEVAGGFELRIFLAPLDSLASITDAEALLNTLDEKYAASGDKRDVTNYNNEGERHGKCELIVCDGVLPPPTP